MKPVPDKDVIQNIKDDLDSIFWNNVDKLGGLVDTSTNKFAGPCGDSFCYASCDMAVCRYEMRKGKTPKEHNEKVMELAKLEPNYYALSLILKKLELKQNKVKHERGTTHRC